MLVGSYSAELPRKRAVLRCAQSAGPLSQGQPTF